MRVGEESRKDNGDLMSWATVEKTQSCFGIFLLTLSSEILITTFRFRCHDNNFSICLLHLGLLQPPSHCNTVLMELHNYST